MRAVILSVLCMGLLGGTGVHAQSIAPDRPGSANSASTLTQATLQAEGGISYQNNGVGIFEVGELLLRYGFADGVELRAGINSYAFVESPIENGYTGTSVGAKVGLQCGTDPSCPFRLSLLADTQLPTGTGAFDSVDDRVRQTALLAAESMLGESLSWTTNVGANFFFTDPIGEEWVFTNSLDLAITPATGAYVGYAGFFRDGPNTSLVEAGMTFSTSPGTQLDVNAGFRVDDNADGYFIGMGFATQL